MNARATSPVSPQHLQKAEDTLATINNWALVISGVATALLAVVAAVKAGSGGTVPTPDSERIHHG